MNIALTLCVTALFLGTRAAAGGGEPTVQVVGPDYFEARVHSTLDFTQDGDGILQRGEFLIDDLLYVSSLAESLRGHRR